MSFAYYNNLYLLIFLLPLVWFIGFPTRAFRRRRDIASLILRTVIVVLLVFALSGLQVVQVVENLAVMFIVDVSDSIGAELREDQLAFIENAIADKAPEDQWGIIVVGGSATVDRSLSEADELVPIRSNVFTGHTNLAEAIQKAIAIFPRDVRRRIVVLSDGLETLGSAEAVARRAEASGIEISYVSFNSDPLPDARIIDLEAPARVTEGQEFDISVTIESDEPVQGNLLIFSSGSLINEQPVDLQAGRTSYTITQQSETSGFLNFSARIELPAERDNFSQNNQLAAFSQVVGPPRVLVVADADADVEHLIPALENAGLNVDRVSPGNLPPDTSALADYKSVLVVNVPADRFSTQQMERMQSYVRDLGGGLLVIGGPDSYGPGRYYQTPLEETLPVEMQIKDEQRLPRLTIAYLVDSSGSMAATDSGGVPYLELAKRAINISIDLLQPLDRAAVGTFDVGGSWLIPFQDVMDKVQFQAMVNTLRPGGGTDIRSGMNLVAQDIVQEPSQRKHIILMTDGGANPRGLVEQTETLFNDFGVTTSVIAMGGSPPDFLEGMAIAGQGQYYEVRDISQLPRIFAQDTVLAGRTFIEEGEFTATQAALSPVLDGINALPVYNGYVATTLKDTAQAVLRGPEPYEDPLLATWQYGLGRAAAYTSDATARWSTDWVTWDQFARFWGQVVSWTITESAANNIETRVVMDGNRARIIVDAQDDNGAFLNNLQLNASIVDPENEAQSIRLRQVAPGQYEAAFQPSQEGAYFIAINGSGNAGDEPLAFNEVTGWVMGYSPEYVQRLDAPDLLGDIARITGGSDLATLPADAFAPADDPRTAATPVFPYLLLIAIFLLPFDIAVRRIVLSREDFRRLGARLRRTPTPDEAHEARMSSLMDARQRARARLGAEDDDEPPYPTPASPDAPAPRPRRRPTRERRAAPPRSGEASTVGTLLKRRRTEETEQD